MSKPTHDIYVNPLFPDDSNDYKFLYYEEVEDEHRSWHEDLLSGTNTGTVPVPFSGICGACGFVPEKAIPNIFIRSG